MTQDEAIKKANELFKEKKPHAVIYGYHVKRGINAKESHEFLDRPIVCETRDKLNLIVKHYLSKDSVTRDEPSKITGLDVLYHALDESVTTKTLKAVKLK